MSRTKAGIKSRLAHTDRRAGSAFVLEYRVLGSTSSEGLVTIITSAPQWKSSNWTSKRSRSSSTWRKGKREPKEDQKLKSQHQLHQRIISRSASSYPRTAKITLR